MPVGQCTDPGAVRSFLRQPGKLGRARSSLMKLAGRVQADELPAAGPITIIIGDIVPVFKIRRDDSRFILVIADSWIRDAAERRKKVEEIVY